MLDYQVKEAEQQAESLDERVIEIARVAKVVKGGRRFRFRVTLIMGDNHGKVGMGVGKANAVPDAMRKATDRARKDMHQVFLLRAFHLLQEQAALFLESAAGVVPCPQHRHLIHSTQCLLVQESLLPARLRIHL